jgi:hypothetical protein
MRNNTLHCLRARMLREINSPRMVHNMYRCYLTFAAANGKIRKSHGDAIDLTEIEAGVVAWLMLVYSQMAQARAQKR